MALPKNRISTLHNKHLAVQTFTEALQHKHRVAKAKATPRQFLRAAKLD